MSRLWFILWAFLSTEILECLTALIVQRSGKILPVCLVANITNPIVNLILLLVSLTGSPLWYYGSALLLEVGALIYEALLYKYMGGVTTGRGFKISALCNGVSLVIGSGLVLLIRFLIS